MFCRAIAYFATFTSTTLQAVLVLASSGALAGPYYVINETFALQLTADGTSTTGEVIAFLPRRYLLYVVDRSKTIPIGRSEYLPARTQDGVNVLVIDTDVSRREFAVSIGQHEIIFNTNSRLCKKVACSDSDDEVYWKVNAGDSFHIVSEADVITLEGDEEITAYLSADELDKLMIEGVVTRADKTLPRYDFSPVRIATLSTQCDEVRTAGTPVRLQPPDEMTMVSEALAAFNMGKPDPNSPNQILSNVAYGEAGKSIDFWHYKVIENTKPDVPGKEMSIVGIYYYKCSRDFGVEKRHVIEEVKFWISRNNKRVAIARQETNEDEGFQTADDLEDFTDAPYLISINSYEQYVGAIRVLSGRFDDRSLAGFFISEINRSCKSKYRSKHCQEYEYPWVPRTPRPRPDQPTDE